VLARLVDDQVVRNAKQPAQEVLGRFPVHVLNGPYPGFLEPLVCFGGAVGEAGQKPKQRAPRVFHQRTEGFGITGKPGFQELGMLSIHVSFRSFFGLHYRRRMTGTIYCNPPG
jgi:hypothetical protein